MKLNSPGSIKKPVTRRRKLSEMKDTGRPLGGAPKITEEQVNALVGAEDPDIQYETPPDLEPEQEAAEPEETVTKKLEDADDELVDKLTQYSNNFDRDAFNDAYNTLMSSSRRKAIEKDLKPLDLTDLVTSGQVQQVISIVPGQLEIAVRTYSQKEYVWLLENIYRYYSGNAEFIAEMLNTFKVVCSLVAVNGKRIPDHRDPTTKDIDDKRFNEKLKIVTAFPTQLLADISVQCAWFNDRVLRLFSKDQLKNG